jgi:hypothetical protein
VESIVKLRYGNLFDGPADMIVLPCSTSGTITGFVARSLVNYSMPHPRIGMRLGDVEIMPFDGADHIAQYVAFAASVEASSSSLAAIEAIGSKLGEFTRKESSVRSISAPLLGTGAGGLHSDMVVTALKRGFSTKAVTDATLVIHVLHEELYQRLKRKSGMIGSKPPIPTRVFISHTSQAAIDIEWVEALALYLLERGVQVRLDRFHLRRGMDFAQWMCNELAMAQKVIVICDEVYKRKADGRLGGVGWETMLIQGDIANLPSDSTKYQVIVRTENLDHGLPQYLKTRYAFHAPASYRASLLHSELLRELLDLPIAPQLETKEFVL